MGDDAQIDEELLFMRALEDIDEMHIRLLARIADTYPPRIGPGWSARMIGEADPGLANGAPALLGTLQLHGLVVEVVRNRPIQGEGANQAFYNITRQGRDFLNRLVEAPDVCLPQECPMTGPEHYREAEQLLAEEVFATGHGHSNPQFRGDRSQRRSTISSAAAVRNEECSAAPVA